MNDAHLRSTDWTVQAIPQHAIAVEFIRRHHYARGATSITVYRHGLYRADMAPLVYDLSGVALWIPPTPDAAKSVGGDEWQGVLSLSRLAVAPWVPTNGATFLLGRSMRMIDRKQWPWLVTYADTAQGHTGAIYRATNWTCLGPVPGRDSWVTPKGVQRGLRRGDINLTQAQAQGLGWTKQPAAPKIKFVHRARR